MRSRLADIAAWRRVVHRSGAALMGAVCVGVLAVAPARAALFEDDDARRAILELRKENEQMRARMAELNNQVKLLSDQLTQTQRSLLDVNAGNEQLRAELARLRGQDETLTRDVADLQKVVKEGGQSTEDRLRKLEPQAPTAEVRESRATADEKRVYEEAIGQLRIGEYDKAAAALSAFLRKFPNSGYSDIARYWLGNAQYGRRDYKEAINSFRTFVAAAPTHARAPEAMLAMANCQIEMQDGKAARRTLEELIRNYPQSEAAVAGRERIAQLK